MQRLPQMNANPNPYTDAALTSVGYEIIASHLL